MNITWSEDAKKKYVQTIVYLKATWGKEVAKAFREKMNNTLKTLSNNPNAFPYSKKVGIKKCVVTKHNLLLFIENGDTLDIIDFTDSRSDHPY